MIYVCIKSYKHEPQIAKLGQHLGIPGWNSRMCVDPRYSRTSIPTSTINNDGKTKTNSRSPSRSTTILGWYRTHIWRQACVIPATDDGQFTHQWSVAAPCHLQRTNRITILGVRMWKCSAQKILRSHELFLFIQHLRRERRNVSLFQETIFRHCSGQVQLIGARYLTDFRGANHGFLPYSPTSLGHFGGKM